MCDGDEIERFKLDPEPQTIEELRRLEAQMPPPPGPPRHARSESRTSLDCPVRLAWETSDGQRHMTEARARQVAATSVYLEIETGARITSPNLVLELETGRKFSLCAFVRVARVQQNEKTIGIAVVLEDQFEVLPTPGLTLLPGPRRATASSPTGPTVTPRHWGCPETRPGNTQHEAKGFFRSSRFIAVRNGETWEEPPSGSTARAVQEINDSGR